MTICPLCSERAGKRYCPAKDARICAVCCGTKREIEIDCPGSCGYLRAGRDYEAEKRVPDAELAARVQEYDDDFFEEYSAVLDIMSMLILQERQESPWLVDNDVIEVYKALNATMKTLSGGIYYESLPDGMVRIALFQRLKSALDELMEPDPESASDRRILKVSEAIKVLDFLTFAAQANSGIRPKSRRYLDMLADMAERAGAQAQARPSGLIIP